MYTSMTESKGASIDILGFQAQKLPGKHWAIEIRRAKTADARKAASGSDQTTQELYLGDTPAAPQKTNAHPLISLPKRLIKKALRIFAIEIFRSSTDDPAIIIRKLTKPKSLKAATSPRDDLPHPQDAINTALQQTEANNRPLLITADARTFTQPAPKGAEGLDRAKQVKRTLLIERLYQQDMDIEAEKRTARGKRKSA